MLLKNRKLRNKKFDLPDLSGMESREKIKTMYDCLQSFKDDKLFKYYGYAAKSPYIPFFDKLRILILKKKTIVGREKLTFGHIAMLGDMYISGRNKEGIKEIERKFEREFKND